MRGFLVAMLVTALLYGLGFLLFVWLLPDVPAAVPRADGIVALTGADARLDAAASLFAQGSGKRLLISGADPTTSKNTLKDMVHGGRRFDCCADIGYAAEDTHGNAVEAADWARDHGFKSLIIVTSRYHMPRSLREFGSVMPDTVLIAYPVEQGGIDLSDWWDHPRTALLLQREYAKYLASVAMTSVAGWLG